MPETFKKSGILEWSDENIVNSPTSAGVFVLTNSPTNGTVVDLRCVENLHDRLEELFRSNTIQPNFFYWYSAQNMEEANVLFEKLRSHYNFNPTQR